MLLLKIDIKKKTPIYRQILHQLIQLIETNVLKPGDQLPSTRKLAEQYELNRNTVYKAYQELWALGYIESKSGSYSTIRDRKNIKKKNFKYKNEVDWTTKINSSSKKLIKTEQAQDKQSKKNIDLTPLSPDPEIVPTEEFRKCTNEVLKNTGSECLMYGSPYGYEPLRDYISQHLQLHGIDVAKDEIIITNGAQHAIELILKLFVEPDSTVLIESPTYSAIIPLLRYYNANIIEIPLRDDGMDLKVLESVLKKHHPKLLYTMPNFHNPTGITTSQAHREKLLEICEQYQLPVIEDGFVEEMKYFGKNILPVKSMDKSGLVFYLGTFSKVLFPGIRIGWIASSKYCTDRFAEQIKASALAVNQLNQAALELYCTKGLYEKQLKRIHTLYRKRMSLALKTLRDHLNSSKVIYSKPIGGYVIWFEIKNADSTEDQLLQAIFEQGVKVSSGKESFYTTTNTINFRISIAHRNENEIEHGLKIITQIINNL